MALVDALRTFMYVSLWGKPVISVARGLSGLIKSIFRSGEQGFAYDINDLSTLYQDAAGTTPVTGAGQPVGLVLDKSKGLVLGAELVIDGGFNDPTKWITPAGFSISSGKFVADGSATGSGYQSLIGMNPNSHYLVEFDVVSSIGVGASFFLGSGSTVVVSGVGHKKFIMRRGANSNAGFNIPTAGVSVTVDNLSVKEIAGNHAYQTTSASRPLLQRNATTGAYYLAFDGTDDFLVTNSIDFTATDKVSLFAGVRKLSDAAIASFIKLGVDVPFGRFEVLLPPAVSSARYELSSDSAWAQFNFNASPVSGVLVGFLDRSAPSSASGEISSRLNGTVNPIVVNSGTNSTGNFGNLPIYIGRRSGTSLPFNGHIYSLIGIGRLSTDAETTNLEKAIAKNVGVPL